MDVTFDLASSQRPSLRQANGLPPAGSGGLQRGDLEGRRGSSSPSGSPEGNDLGGGGDSRPGSALELNAPERLREESHDDPHPRPHSASGGGAGPAVLTMGAVGPYVLVPVAAEGGSGGGTCALIFHIVTKMKDVDYTEKMRRCEKVAAMDGSGGARRPKSLQFRVPHGPLGCAQVDTWGHAQVDGLGLWRSVLNRSGSLGWCFLALCECDHVQCHLVRAVAPCHLLTPRPGVDRRRRGRRSGDAAADGVHARRAAAVARRPAFGVYPLCCWGLRSMDKAGPVPSCCLHKSAAVCAHGQLPGNLSGALEGAPAGAQLARVAHGGTPKAMAACIANSAVLPTRACLQ